MTDLSKLRHFSTAIFSETKSVSPIFFFIFGVSTYQLTLGEKSRKSHRRKILARTSLRTYNLIFSGVKGTCSRVSEIFEKFLKLFS